MASYVNKKGVQIEDPRFAGDKAFFEVDGETKEIKEKTFKNAWAEAGSEKATQWLDAIEVKKPEDFSEVIAEIVESDTYDLDERGNEVHTMVFTNGEESFKYETYIKPKHDGFSKTFFGTTDGRLKDFNNVGVRNCIIGHEEKGLSGIADKFDMDTVKLVKALTFCRRNAVAINRETFSAEAIANKKEEFVVKMREARVKKAEEKAEAVVARANLKAAKAAEATAAKIAAKAKAAEAKTNHVAK